MTTLSSAETLYNKSMARIVTGRAWEELSEEDQFYWQWKASITEKRLQAQAHETLVAEPPRTSLITEIVSVRVSNDTKESESSMWYFVLTVVIALILLIAGSL